MSQAVEGTHTAVVGKARRHRALPMRIRIDQGTHEGAGSGRNWRSLAGTVSLMAVALISTAAPVTVLLALRGVAVSPPLLNVALDVCRVITGLSGLLTVVSAVSGGDAGSSCQDIFGSIVAGLAGIAAAIAGLGLVIVVTGLAGLALLCGSAVATVEAFRTRRREPAAYWETVAADARHPSR